jgi:hypothetical protein
MEDTVPKPRPPTEFAKVIVPEGKEVMLPVYRGTMGPPMIDIT